MRNSRFLRQALVLSAAGWVWVSGCTSNTTSSGTVVGSNGTLSHQLADAYCRRLAACCAGTTLPATDAGAGDAGAAGVTVPCSAAASPDGGASATCVARAELSANQQLALIGTAYGEGLVSVSSAVASTCTAAYEARACGTGSADLNVEEALGDPACAGLFIGNIPVGERCDTTIECVSTAFCQSQGTQQPITSLSGAGTLGVCFPYQQAGKSCNATADCQPPLTCGATTSVCQ